MPAAAMCEMPRRGARSRIIVAPAARAGSVAPFCGIRTATARAARSTPERRAHRGERTLLAAANRNDVASGSQCRARTPANPATAAAATVALPECFAIGSRCPADARGCRHEGFLVAGLGPGGSRPHQQRERLPRISLGGGKPESLRALRRRSFASMSAGPRPPQFATRRAAMVEAGLRPIGRRSLRIALRNPPKCHDPSFRAAARLG